MTGSPVADSARGAGAGGAPSRVRRLLPMGALAALHVGLYVIVNRVNRARPPGALHDFTTPLDRWIPFLPWTFVTYYLGDLYMLLWGGYVLLRLSPAGFRRALWAYAGTIVVGAAVQLLLPAQAPWPPDPGAFQGWIHGAIDRSAYACLPSMHVALSFLPAGLSLSVLQHRWARWLSVLGAVTVMISTLTLKEHYALDAVTGAALGLGAWWCWKRAGGASPAAGLDARP